MPPRRQQPNGGKPGPKPEIIKLEQDVEWTDALKHMMGKPKPKQGWGECEHPHITREVVAGQKTGECVCQDCGQTFTYQEAAEIAAKRDKAK